jgi:hypothetical protein
VQLQRQLWRRLSSANALLRRAEVVAEDQTRIGYRETAHIAYYRTTQI